VPVNLGGTERGHRYPGTYFAVARRAYSHFISQMSAHSLRELLCLLLSTLCFLRDIAFKLYVVRFDDSSRGKTKIYDRRLLKPSKISIKPTQPFSVSSRQIPPNLHSSSRLKVRPNLRTPLRMQVISHLKSFNTSPPTLDTANR